jgi:gamma-glutamyltranspeptidase
MNTGAQALRGGAVATSHHAATDAGARALELGGTAVDAAIAAAAALCVVYPNNVALGSDLVALVRDPSGRTRFVNATGRAARGETLDELRRRHGDEMPVRGVDTVTIPGALRGWSTLADIGGSLSWSERLEPARILARTGHPVARSVARAIASERHDLEGFDGWSTTFLPGGHALAEGDLLVQPQLADTLDRIAAIGPSAFYEGDLAGRWISALRRAGSKLDEDEVAAYQATVGQPLLGTVLGHDVLTGRPNTQGFALLRTLRGLELLSPTDPLGADAGALAMLFRDANRVRAAYLADPDVGMDGEQLLTVETPGPLPIPPNAQGDTVGLVAVSDDGWAVSLIQSVFEPFGSGVLDPDSGVLFQNRGSSFSLDASHPAAFAGGRRPPHTLMPVLVERDGSLAYATATMGGQAQPQIHAQLLLRLFGGASATDATSAPRWIVGRQEGPDTAESLIMEADLPESSRRSLLATQLVPRTVSAHSEIVGHSNVIRVQPDGYDAASDPRSDGSARVVVEKEGVG